MTDVRSLVSIQGRLEVEFGWANITNVSFGASVSENVALKMVFVGEAFITFGAVKEFWFLVLVCLLMLLQFVHLNETFST